MHECDPGFILSDMNYLWKYCNVSHYSLMTLTWISVWTQSSSVAFLHFPVISSRLSFWSQVAARQQAIIGIVNWRARYVFVLFCDKVDISLGERLTHCWDVGSPETGLENLDTSWNASKCWVCSLATAKRINSHLALTAADGGANSVVVIETEWQLPFTNKRKNKNKKNVL